MTLNVLAICHKLTALSAYSAESVVMTGSLDGILLVPVVVFKLSMTGIHAQSQ